MKLADLPEEQIAPAPEGGGGGRSQIKDITARFRSQYEHIDHLIATTGSPERRRRDSHGRRHLAALARSWEAVEL